MFQEGGSTYIDADDYLTGSPDLIAAGILHRPEFTRLRLDVAAMVRGDIAQVLKRLGSDQT